MWHHLLTSLWKIPRRCNLFRKIIDQKNVLLWQKLKLSKSIDYGRKQVARPLQSVKLYKQNAIKTLKNSINFLPSIAARIITSLLSIITLLSIPNLKPIYKHKPDNKPETVYNPIYKHKPDNKPETYI